VRSLEQDVEFFLVDGPGYTEDEAYALLAGIGRETSTLPPITAAFWKSSDHPRAGDGKFIDVDGIDLTGFDGRIATAARTPDAIRDVTPLEFGGFGRYRAKEPDPKIAHAVGIYMSGAFEDINGGLRQSKGNPGKVTGSSSSPTGVRGTTTVRGALTNLDQAMTESKLRDDVVVSRGIINPEKVFGKLWSDDVTGLSWREFGFSSTSPNRNYARNYARDNDGVMMNIVVPKGTGALFVEEELGGEAGVTHHELVLDRGLRYRVVRDRGIVDGIRTLDVEVS
jgi:hypothetical protein